MIYFDPSGTVAGLEQCLLQGAAHQDATGLLVLACDANGFVPAELDPVLQRVEIPLIGGIFPRIIHGSDLHERGSIVVAIPGLASVELVSNLSDPDADYEHILAQKLPDSSDIGTLILFVDGFASRISAFIESLFNVFGLDFNYVGGGAGSTSLTRKPYILANQGMQEDAAILAFLTTPSGIGVAHGWEELCGPFQVTSSRPSSVTTIEWETAYQFYRRTLQEAAGIQVEVEGFYDIARNYPFGIARLSGEQIVRDPYMVDRDGGLRCVGDIQEGSFISILHGEKNSLIEAAAEALNLSLANLGADTPVNFCLFVDCISRIAVLDGDFSREIEAVNRTGLPLVGVCSVGEIANSGAEYLELFNKTSVMAVLAAT